MIAQRHVQRREVQRRWNVGETAAVIAKALRVSSRTVYGILSRLRFEEADLRSHPRGRIEQTEVPILDPDVVAVLDAVAPSPVTVYDAAGHPVAQIDPKTRRRTTLP